MSKQMMGWGAVIVSVLMASTQYFGFPGNLNYLWAILVLVWGLKAFK